MLDDPLRCLPYPELVETRFDDRDYEIHDSRHFRGAPSIGMVSKVDRVMLVPLSADGHPVRRHELAHVKWSPQKLPKVPYDQHILLAVEDARINIALQRRGLDCSDTPPLRGYILQLARRDIAEKEFGVYILRCIASLGTDLTPRLLELSRIEAPTAHAIVARFVTMVATRFDESRRRTRGQEVASFRAALRIAAELAEELQRSAMPISTNGRRRLMAAGGLCLSCNAKGVEIEGVSLPGRIGGAQDREAAKMHIAEPDLPVAFPATGRNSGGRRAVREGLVVRSVNRWYSDRKIFRGRARSCGGAVLIDTSSSMRLCASDVDRIVKHAPSATLVAIYSGRHGEGELRIVARNGRRAVAEDLTPFGPGNLIDLPALEWLAKQPGPRVWLSDARVTGVNDFASRILARRCRIVCLKHKIRRAETANQAAAILEGRALRLLPVMV